MRGIEEKLYSLSRLDVLSRGNTPVHRIDPRIKILLTFAFIIAVTSCSQYAVIELLPFAAFPVFFAAAADLPTAFLLQKLLIISPFAVLIGIFNPLFDRDIMLSIGRLQISGGWVSFVSILIRYLLCMSSVLILTATTGFYRICTSMQSLKVPSVLTMQFLLLYRYLFLLADEVLRLTRARKLRSFGRKSPGLKSTSLLLTSLLFRTLHRSGCIHNAMCSRGLHGSLPRYEQPAIRLKDIILASVILAAFTVLRFFNLSGAIGMLITGASG